MFGQYFGASYFGDSYFGPGSGVVPPVVVVHALVDSGAAGGPTKKRKTKKAAVAKDVRRPGVTFGKQTGPLGGDEFIGTTSYSEPEVEPGETPEIEAPIELPIIPPQQPAAEDKFFESMNRLAGDLDQPVTMVAVEPIDDFPTNEDIMALIVMMAEMAEA